jgi:hypothetical protein
MRVPEETQREVSAACERDLAVSIAFAQMYHRLREQGRIAREITFADFIAIAEVARGWETRERQIVRD